MSRLRKTVALNTPRLALHVGVPKSKLPLAPAKLRADVVSALTLAGFSGSMSLAIVTDDEMRRVNREFHATDAPTDVLAFALSQGGAGTPGASDTVGAFDAEVIVSLDTARREAAARGVTPAAELMLYVVHGTLHLLGHDDHDDGKAAVMHARTLAILVKLGYANTIHVPKRRGSKPK